MERDYRATTVLRRRVQEESQAVEVQAATITWVNWRGNPREDVRAVICRGPYRPTRASAMTRLGLGVGSPIGSGASISVAIPFLRRGSVGSSPGVRTVFSARRTGARPLRSETIVAMLRDDGNGVRTSDRFRVGDFRTVQARTDSVIAAVCGPAFFSLLTATTQRFSVGSHPGHRESVGVCGTRRGAP
jgi:hypothetical protein